ncbi:hypothetical protein [Spiroplasma endosymbiont of Virgichneumon dumeticola]|uniref:hypothetical protein n=1 Tax=Spiroplasma endosymbiont of Virgichneumon dumeticola TaxID=3139323 RepID=UPI0035C8DEFC
MNKKILCGTLSGIIIGGMGFTFSFLKFFEKNIEIRTNKNFDIDLSIIACIGSFVGGFSGFLVSSLISDCIEERSEREAYREFFESQRIENIPNQLVNESTPLLQEHILNINNEENLLNTNNHSNHNHCIIL